MTALRSLLLVAVLLAVFGTARCAKVYKSNRVAKLTDDNFEDSIKKGKWLVKFYAPWCGHCKSLAPKFVTAANTLAGKWNFAEVDATANSVLKDKYDIHGYPVINLYDDGKLVTQYKGPREITGILQFHARLSQPPVKRLSSLQQVKEFVELTNDMRNQEDDPVSFILVLSKASEMKDKVYKNVYKVAKELHNSHFFGVVVLQDVSDQGSLMRYLGLDATPAKPFLVKMEFQEKAVLADVDLSSFDAVMDWVKENSLSVLNRIDLHNFFEISSRKKLIVIGCTDPAATKKTKPFVQALRLLAREHTTTLPPEVHDKFIFGYLDAVKWRSFVDQFGIDDPRTLPRVFVLDSENAQFFEDELVDEEDEIDTFLQEIVAGKVSAQREGLLGYPWRYYKKFIKSLPYSAAALGFAVLGCFFLVKLACAEDTVEDDEELESKKEM